MRKEDKSNVGGLILPDDIEQRKAGSDRSFLKIS